MMDVKIVIDGVEIPLERALELYKTLRQIFGGFDMIEHRQPLRTVPDFKPDWENGDHVRVIPCITGDNTNISSPFWGREKKDGS